MFYKFLRDVEVYGHVHKQGETHPLVYPDKVVDKTLLFCMGHGQYWDLKIGYDVEILPDAPKCPYCGHDLPCTP